MEDTSSRKLAVILHADIVGSTALVQLNETIAHERIRDAFQRFSETIRNHRGIPHEIRGDALVAEFAKASDAVSASLAFQVANDGHNKKLSDDIRPVARIGIAMGEVVVADNTVTGEGVVLAQRLEQMAEPSSIVIQGAVYETIPKRLPFEYENLGERQVKGFDEPVRMYTVREPEFKKPDETAMTATEFFEKPSIAVLPFTNLSGDPEQEYFSDGLSEDIITLLSAWRSFPVVSRNSSFVFKEQRRDVRQIALELSARYVIEGSVRKSGDRVRVSAQLIDAETGHHLWAEKFDGLLDDIFEIQDDITLQIVSLVEPQLEEAERNKTETLRSSNLSAWNYYLQGRSLLHKLTAKATAEARPLFEKAIQLDPKYSDAYAGLSYTYQREILLEAADDRAGWEKKALEAARRAVDLDNGSSLAHLALGGAYIWSNKHELSVAETRTAVEFNPSNVLARLALGNRLDIIGESDEGIPLLKKSLELNPLDPHSHIYYAQLARAYINARDYQRALSCLRESIRRKPDYPHTYHVMAICLGHLDRIEDARDAAAKCEELHEGFITKRAHWNIYLDAKANEHLTNGLRKAGLVE